MARPMAQTEVPDRLHPPGLVVPVVEPPQKAALEGQVVLSALPGELVGRELAAAW